jgi:2-methylcitrate dehydratase PrpD
VTVTLRNGRRLTATRLFPKGDPQEPLSASEIEAKFLQNASARLTQAQAIQLAKCIRNLPEDKDLSRLNGLIAL